VDVAARDEVLRHLLKIATDETNVDLKAFATIYYARLAAPGQAYEAVKKSFASHAIDSDAYYAEISRIFLNAGATPDLRSALISEMISAKNRYAAEVLFSIVPHADISQLSRADIENLTSYVESSQPRFAADISILGVSSATEYTNWLYSMAALSTPSREPEAINKYLLDKFKDGFSDPREAVSILMNQPSPSGQGLATASPALHRLVMAEVERYAQSYPNNPLARELRDSSGR
jgi:hypothetical protein